MSDIPTKTPELFKSLERLPNEPPKAYALFLAYIDMGVDRSIAKLVELHRQNVVKQGRKATPMRTIQSWSSPQKWKWQARLDDYLRELAAYQSQRTRERLAAIEEQSWGDYEALHTRLNEMLEEFDKLKMVKRTRVKDPRDPAGLAEIETVYLKVNTVDLERLVRSFGTLGKDLRAQLMGEGRGGVVSITTPAGVGGFKAYIGFSPDEWPDKGITPDAQKSDAQLEAQQNGTTTDLDISPTQGSLLNTGEWAVYDHLTQAFNHFLALDVIHAADVGEFAQAVNAAKNILLSRPVARELQAQFFDGYIQPPEDLSAAWDFQPNDNPPDDPAARLIP